MPRFNNETPKPGLYTVGPSRALHTPGAKASDGDFIWAMGGQEVDLRDKHVAALCAGQAYKLIPCKRKPGRPGPATRARTENPGRVLRAAKQLAAIEAKAAPKSKVKAKAAADASEGNVVIEELSGITAPAVVAPESEDDAEDIEA